MINFRYCGFVDCFSLVGSLRARLNLFSGGDLQTLLLRAVDEDGKVRVHPQWRKWPELTNRIKQAQRAVDPEKLYDLGRVALELLKPGGIVGWNRETDQSWLRFHLAIVTNPVAMFYAGPESLAMQTGMINWVNVGVLTSQVNFGESQRIHLVADFRNRETEASG